jgi:hypothetical protein
VRVSDVSADNRPPVKISLHELLIRLAEGAHNFVAFAHGDESPVAKWNPLREFHLHGKRVPIGERELIRRPAMVAGALSAFRFGIDELARRQHEHPERMKLELAPDGSSIQEGCGGKYGQNWHEVATILSLEMNKLADSIFPRSKRLMASRGTREQTEALLATLPEQERQMYCILDAEEVERFYGAIRRVFKPFNSEQLEARMRAEYVQSEERKPPGHKKKTPGRKSDEERDEDILQTIESNLYGSLTNVGKQFGGISRSAVSKAAKRARERRSRKKRRSKNLFSLFFSGNFIGV